MRGLRVLMLGQGRVELDTQPLTRLMPLKHQALVFYLAAADEPVPRSRLATLLWGEHDEHAARASLRVALTRLRRSLPGCLDIDERRVGFPADASPTVDWRLLGDALRADASQHAREAASRLWRGPLLDGLELAGGDAFEQWLRSARQRAQREVVALRHMLSRDCEAAGAVEAAIGHARDVLDADEADEAAHMALMRLLAARGQRVAALAQYETCRAVLAERLGARPSAECHALYVRVHADAGPAFADRAAIRVAPAPAAGPAWAPAPGSGAMPVTVSTSPDTVAAPDRPPGPRLIGREAELALLLRRLSDPECRWLTLIGPGGVGKSRLAQHAAHALAPRLRCGVLCFSGRDAGGALRDAPTLARQVLEHVGADREAPGAVLLVLDNLETVDEAGELPAELANRVPGAIVLATSRRRIGGAREWLLELGGLSIERAADGRAASSPASLLFELEARRLEPGFDRAAEAEAVDRICAQVGGLPLALEMAARAVRLAGSAAGVEKRLLAGGALADPDRDGSDPHRSLDLVLADSWNLLEASSRADALRLAWVPAGIDAELAAAAGVDEAGIATLRDHCWLQHAGGARFTMHPLQQAFLRRRAGAAAPESALYRAVAAFLRSAMPEVAPFGDLSTEDAARGEALAGSAVCAAPMISGAAGAVCAEADCDALGRWIDAAVAMLLHVDRHAEAAALLERALARADLPKWRSTGWALRRAELLSGEGGLVALHAYLHAFDGFGLGRVTPDRAGWSTLPRACARLLARQDWPPAGPARLAFDTLLLRSLNLAAVYLTFSPDPMPATRLAVLVDLQSRRIGERDGFRQLIAGWGMLSFGQLRQAARLERRVAAASRGRTVGAVPRPCPDRRLDALILEGHCALRIAIGRWAGLGPALDDVAARWAALRNVRHEMGARSLAAKFAFYEGRLHDAARGFAAVSDAGLSRPAGAWRAWGVIGELEVALCLDAPGDARLQQLFERARAVIHGIEDYDAAYTLRHLGIAARLAARHGDHAAARDAVLAGCAAAARIAHCGFWAHEGYANLGDVLLELRREARAGGDALAPTLDEAWTQLAAALRGHARRFAPAVALVERLHGERALDEGRGELAIRRLARAVAASESQGMRVELARALGALERAEPHGRGHGERSARVWQALRQPAAASPSTTRPPYTAPARRTA